MSLWQNLSEEKRDAVHARLREMHNEHMGWGPDGSGMPVDIDSISLTETARSPVYQLLGGFLEVFYGDLSSDSTDPNETIFSSRISQMSDEEVERLIQELNLNN